MPALTVATTALAFAEMNVELPHERSAREFFLKLGLAVRLAEVAATGRASGRQRRFQDFINVLGRRTVGMLAVLAAGLASWLLGVLLGLAPRKRRRLAFAGTLELFKQATKPSDFGVALLHDGLQLGQALLKFQAMGTCSGHTCRLAEKRLVSCPSFTSIFPGQNQVCRGR
jgi:hypothetical protein